MFSLYCTIVYSFAWTVWGVTIILLGCYRSSCFTQTAYQEYLDCLGIPWVVLLFLLRTISMFLIKCVGLLPYCHLKGYSIARPGRQSVYQLLYMYPSGPQQLHVFCMGLPCVCLSVCGQGIILPIKRLRVQFPVLPLNVLFP